MHLKSPSEGPLQAVHHLNNRISNPRKAPKGTDLYPFSTTGNELTAYTDRLTIENVAALNNVHINHTNEVLQEKTLSRKLELRFWYSCSGHSIPINN